MTLQLLHSVSLYVRKILFNFLSVYRILYMFRRRDTSAQPVSLIKARIQWVVYAKTGHVFF
jgi:hypothetical protein